MTVVHRGKDSLARSLHALPLRVRLVAVVLALLTIALLLLSLTTAYLTRGDLLDGVDAELRAVAVPVAKEGVESFTAQAEAAIPTGYAFVLMTEEGNPLHVVNPTGESQHPALPPIPLDDPRVQTGEPFTVPSTDGGLEWRFVAGAVTTHATFAVGVPLRSVENTLTRLLVTSGLISLAVLSLCAIIGWYAVARAFRPLRHIEDTAAKIAQGDLSQRVRLSPARDEINSLGASLNVMLAQIEESFALREASRDRMRQFIADASHELRTPLSTVRGYAELRRHGALDDEQEATAAFRRIEAESTRMAGLVEDLLTLARLDEEPATTRTDVDLTVIAADAVTDARARAPHRPIRLGGLQAPLAPTPLRGMESRLRQVATNILANALAHTPADTPIEVHVGIRRHPPTATGPGRNEAVLEVVDHGPGISPEDRQRVFERFVRSDTSRGREAGGGSGLGLAIVAAIVAAHGGRVGVAQTPGGGATIIVELPIADSQLPPTRP